MTWSRSCFLAMAAPLLVGCLAIPTPTFAASEADSGGTPDVATDTAVEVSETGVETDTAAPITAEWALVVLASEDSFALHNEHFAVSFEEAVGWLPTTLSARDGSNQNLVYGDSAVTTEAWIGVSLFDQDHAWMDADAPTVLEQGPAIMQFTKEWGPSIGLHGTTVTTVHADGRIVLAYDMVLAVNSPGATLVAYAVLDAARFTRVQAGTALNETLPTGLTTAGDSTYLSIEGDVDFICASHASNGDVVSVSSVATTGFDPALPRATENVTSSGASSIRLQYDFARNSTPAGTYIGRFQVNVDGTGSCERSSAVGAAFRRPGQLTPDIGTLVTATTGDPQSDGYNERGGYFVVEGDDTGHVRFTLSAATPGLTLRVQGPTWAPPTITLADLTLVDGKDFVGQPATDGNGGWVVITRPVPAGDAVSIDW